MVRHPEPFMKVVHQGVILGEDSEKMSKSRGNVINPDDIVRAHGSDVLRLYEMFMGPLGAVKPWQSSQIQGVRRFRDRLYTTGMRPLGDAIDEPTRRLLHQTAKRVTRDIETLRFNTAISGMMELLNHLGDLPDPLPREAVRTLILLVSPFAPHVAEELWQRGGHDVERTGTLGHEAWPTWDEGLCQEDSVEIAVQVNGRVRGRVVLSRTASEDAARTAALGADGVAPHVADRALKKFVYLPGKIINVVVG
jgi:leucyl-tRNA synthetase